MNSKPVSFIDKLNQWGRMIALLVIVLLPCYLSRHTMNEGPAFIHAWAMGDRYSLAVGFVENGMDLFHPQTGVYNKQFPHDWHYPFETTITAVDFPAHEYVIAFWMRLFGTTDPWVFRLWTLIISIVGLVFLFESAMLITQSWIPSLLAIVVAITSPIYTYYCNSYLPGMPSLAMSAIGLWCYLKSRQSATNDKKKNLLFFYLSIFSITIAAMMRTTFAIFLVAILGFELLRILRKETGFWKKVPAVLISAACVFGYMAWNAHLRAIHGSLFLDHLLPARDWEDAKSLLLKAKENWGKQYFLKAHYQLTIILAILVVLIRVLKPKDKRTEEKQPLSLWLLLGIYLVGNVLFAIVMIKQWPDHDYYFLDTFFLPSILLLILLLKNIPQPQSIWSILASFVLVFCLSWSFINLDKRIQYKRRDLNDRAYQTYLHFKDSDKFLSDNGVARDAKILALDVYPQNGPFIQMGRKGYTLMWFVDERVYEAFSWDYDYIVIENSRMENDWAQKDYILSQLDTIATNGNIILCKKWSGREIYPESVE